MGSSVHIASVLGGACFNSESLLIDKHYYVALNPDLTSRHALTLPGRPPLACYIATHVLDAPIYWRFSHVN